MRYVMKLTVLLATMLALALLASCGGKRSSTTPHLSTSASATFDLPATLAEVDAAPPPEGVEAALWEELKTELAARLTDKTAGKLASDASPFTELKLRVADVDDGYVDPTNRRATLRWSSSYFPADTNGDQIVNVADLTPMAVHFEKEVAEHPNAAGADANRDGVVNISDITVLATWWNRVSEVTIDTTPTVSPHRQTGPYRLSGWDEQGFAKYELLLLIMWLTPHNIQHVTVTATDPVSGASVSDSVMIYLPVTETLRVDDLVVDAVIDWPQVRLTWTHSFFRADANGDGQLGIPDITPIGIFQDESVDETPECAIADIDRDGYVTLDDKDELMRLADELWGISITGYQIEVSGDDVSYSILNPSAYSVEEATSHYGFKQYIARIQELPEMEDIFVRMRPVGTKWDGETEVPFEFEPTPSFRVRGFGTDYPEVGVDDLEVVPDAEPPAVAITWSTSFFRGDGDQNGRIDLYDIQPMAIHFNQDTTVNPEATVADYNGDTAVTLDDITVLSANYYAHLAGFHVELITLSHIVEIERVATVLFTESETDPPRNEFGFRWYRCEIAEPPERPFWVRVVWFDPDGDEGEPSQPLMIE